MRWTQLGLAAVVFCTCRQHVRKTTADSGRIVVVNGRQALCRWMLAALAMFAIFAVRCYGESTPDRDRAAFEAWARRHAIPIETVEPGNDRGDLRAFRRIIGTAHVVELGEPVHGSHEPLAFRNRLFRYAVEELGFTAIAIEAGLPESQRIADYVAGGPGSLAEVVRRNFTWGFGNFHENADLVQWMREYNADPAHHRKVRFYGIDLSLGGPSGSTPTPTALERTLAYLERVDPASARDMRTAFAPYLGRLPAGTVPFSREDHDHLTAAINDLISLFERERLHYLAAAPGADYEWTYRDAIVARQQDQGFRVTPADVPGGGIPPGAWQGMSVRNQAMAENVRWVMEQEGSAGRVLAFAHNHHIMNAPMASGKWSVLERAPNSMGQYLRSMLGHDLVVIGMSGEGAAAGSAVSKSSEPKPDFIDSAFAVVGMPRFVLDLRPAASDAGTARWLAEPHAMRASDGDSLEIVPGCAFDAIVVVDELSPYHPLPAR